MKEKKQVKEKDTPYGTPTIFQKLMPHVIAVIIFAAITLMYFSPMVFENKIIEQGDILQGKGMSKELVDYREKNDEEALWTNSMFGGMPAFQISVIYKGNLLQYADNLLTLGFPHPAELLFLAFVCFYILLITLRVNPWLAIAGSIAYALCSYDFVILEAGHNSKMHSMAVMPLTMAGVLLLRNENYRWGAIITTVGLSLLVLANHLQITFYLMLMLIVWGIVELVYAIREKNYRNLLITSGVILVAGIFSLLTNLSLLWSTYEYVPSTIRGPSELSSNKQSSGGLDHDYAFQWSYGKMETFSFLIPNIHGGASNARLSENSNFGKLLTQFNVAPRQRDQYLQNAPMYWGDQPFTGGPTYLGAIVCFLFVFGLLFIKGRIKWWLLAVSVLAILLAWGRHFQWFSDIFFYYFPGYNKFRTVYMILVLVQFAFPLLGVLVLSKILNREYDRKEIITKLKYSVYITGGICLLFVLLGTSFFNFTGNNDASLQEQQQVLDALIADRKAALRMDALRSLVFILLSGALIWMFVTERVKRNLFLGGITMLIFIDLFFIGKRFLNNDDFVSKQDYNDYYEPTPADQIVLKDTSKDFRVLNLAANTFNDARTSYYHKSVGGYHAAKLRRYQEIIENQLAKKDTANKSGFPFNKSVVDMLNTKYLIIPGQQQGEQVMPNFQAIDNAWFVSSVQTVNNADEEMSALNNFNPATTAIVDKRFSALSGSAVTFDSLASIRLVSYEPNHLVYQSNSSKEGVVVFSEIYYQPGWNSYIDGKKTEHFRCNYILRGMRIPSGEHRIEFRFEPNSYYTGEKIAYASSGLVLLLFAGIIGLEFMRRRKTPA